MSNKVLIGCKLPSGLTTSIDGTKDGKQITLNGMNTSLVAGGYGITSVDEQEAKVFFDTHKDYDPVKSGAIFTHHSSDVSDLIDLGNDLSDLKTGFEGLDGSKPAPGLEEEKDGAAKRKAEAEKAPQPPARAPKSKEDKDAARALANAKLESK